MRYEKNYFLFIFLPGFLIYAPYHPQFLCDTEAGQLSAKDTKGRYKPFFRASPDPGLPDPAARLPLYPHLRDG
jgi:hypothetical protein